MKKLIAISVIALLFSCQRASEERPKATAFKSSGNANYKKEEQSSGLNANNGSYANSDTVILSDANSVNSYLWSQNSDSQKSNGFMSSSSAVEAGKDTSRKFILTAEMRFRVKSVIQATYAIEDIIARQDGFVASTNLTSNIDKVVVTSISVDSSVESTHYTVVNDLVLRVPNTKLDTTLKSIALWIDYLDYRNIRAEDVALKLMENKLAQQRANHSAERLQGGIDKTGKKLNSVVDAEQSLLDRQEQADNAKLANLKLQDEIDFSTIRLSIYQRQAVKSELIANEKNIDAYKPGFGSRIADAFKTGWCILLDLFVLIVNVWWLLALCVIVYMGYRFFIRKK